MARLLTTFGRDETGATAVEFALLAPVLLVTLMGLFDFSYDCYAESMIGGAVQKAARDSTIETYSADPAALDTVVREAVQKVVPSADVTFTRSAYRNYADIDQAEEFIDGNGNLICNNNEVFVDLNGNGLWDLSRARNGTGCARDVVLYDVKAQYDRAFTPAGLLGFEETVTVAARTVLRNQPFRTQDTTTVTGTCL